MRNEPDRETEREMEMDTSATQAQIKGMAVVMRRAAIELDRIAANMASENDLTYAAEAASVVTNTIMGCRLDQLVMAPLRTAIKR